ncbi:hypothetical protein SAV14893_087540 [Streptomyces avermitilis]|uniref:Uncharacterized protein n=1 Tax=Streptomyces avermitilis TaxID=33903 RepID=A0A4D4MBQ9_STRAX|nr:hypothetical protein SAVMC3_09030 [Streptomyces avermitilis]GDY69361.1 hypothetical protein SAV14893_087540 [Streptomyces avermitilis]GDY79611.1 hypothetical protein SAV31267_090960 [Streptomyces avermitilis]
MHWIPHAAPGQGVDFLQYPVDLPLTGRLARVRPGHLAVLPHLSRTGRRRATGVIRGDNSIAARRGSGWIGPGSASNRARVLKRQARKL